MSHALVVLAFCAAACSAVRGPRPADSLPLRVGTSGDYPPFTVQAPDGAYGGFDVTVARAYAAARGRDVVFVPFRWPELATRLAAGDFDVAMSGVTVRGDRLLTGTMTAAVARADAVVLTRRSARARGSWNDPRVRVSVNRGGHLERVARARLPRATLVPVDDNRSLPVLLRDRRVDAVVTDTLEAATYDAGAFTIAARLARDRKAYWAAAGREGLAADLDAWLLERERDGSLARWRAAELGAAVEREAGTTLPPEIARVVDVAARRLLVMPAVAVAKRAAGLPLVDPARERVVVARAVERATAATLDAAAMRRLAEAQIAAARAVQDAVPTGGTADPTTTAPSLGTIRSAIDALDATLVRALVTARDARGAHPEIATVRRSALAAALRADAEMPGFDEAHAGTIAAALAALVGVP